MSDENKATEAQTDSTTDDAHDLSPEQMKQMAVDLLKSVYDPEIPVNIYDLGLIYDVQVYPIKNIYVRMTLTSPACPVAGSLPGEVEQKVRSVPGAKDVQVDLVFDPPWDMDMMSEEAKLELGML
jgi:FeS assembly SUF system protein